MYLSNLIYVMPLSTYNVLPSHIFSFFFFNDPATTEIYTLSLHDALPISPQLASWSRSTRSRRARPTWTRWRRRDRKSTRLNSSHSSISYAVFCLKKKKTHFSRVIKHKTHKYRIVCTIDSLFPLLCYASYT